MDNLSKRLNEKLAEVQAEDEVSQRLDQEAIQEQRRQRMDPSQFGGFDLEPDEEDLEDIEVPEFKLDPDRKTNMDGSEEKTDIISDHEYVRKWNYATSELLMSMMPRMVKLFYTTDNPRSAQMVLDTIEQARKVHKDMLESSKIVHEVQRKGFSKPVGEISARFEDSEGEEVAENKITQTQRLDLMARLMRDCKGYEIPHEAFEALQKGAPIELVIRHVKEEKPIEAVFEKVEKGE